MTMNKEDRDNMDFFGLVASLSCVNSKFGWILCFQGPLVSIVTFVPDPYLRCLRLEVFLFICAATKIDGQPIVKLPERIVNLRQAEFSDEERAFYNDLENESRKQFQVPAPYHLFLFR